MQTHNITIHAQYPWHQQGVVALYSYETVDSRSQIPTRMFNYALLQQQGLAWHVRQSSGFGHAPAPQTLAYKTDTINDITVVFGQSLDPQVAAVEVVFAPNQVVRQAVTDGWFFRAAPQPQTGDPTDVRLLDAHGVVISSYQQPKLIIP